ncbi:hypothetical protein NEOLEDRAFT_1141759, partial [Neolentinus lepideus HHB14362 ss-1]
MDVFQDMETITNNSLESESMGEGNQKQNDKHQDESSSSGRGDSDVTKAEIKINLVLKESDVYSAFMEYTKDLFPDKPIFTETGNAGQTRRVINWDSYSESYLWRKGVRLPPRTGTWQFMSYELLKHPLLRYYPNGKHDRESFFWVLYYTCLCFIPSSFSTSDYFYQALEEVLDDSWWEEEDYCLMGGDGKAMVIFDGRYILPYSRTEVPEIKFAPAPLNSLLYELFWLFHDYAHYNHNRAYYRNIPMRWALASRANLLCNGHEILRLFRNAVESPDWMKDNDRQEKLLATSTESLEAVVKRSSRSKTSPLAKSRRASHDGDATSSRLAALD